MKKVFVSDFTLRQSDRNAPALSFREKTAMAKCLDNLGVDAVELAAVKNGREDSIVLSLIHIYGIIPLRNRLALQQRAGPLDQGR